MQGSAGEELIDKELEQTDFILVYSSSLPVEHIFISK